MSVLLRGAFPGARLDAQGDGPKWNLLFPRGEWHGANLKPIGGSIVIDEAMLQEVVANWRDAGKPALPVRKTHLHLDADVPAVDRPELEKSYGLLTDFRVTAAGLEALTEWTDEGRGVVKAGEFNFWSPEWQPKHVDRRTGDVKGWWVSGTALTNDPFFNSMPRVAAETAPAAAAPTLNPTKALAGEEKHMDKKRICAALGLPESCGDDEVYAAIEAKCKAAAEKTGTLTASDVSTAVKAAVEPIEKELAVTRATLLERDLDSLIASKKAGDGRSGRAIDESKVKPVLLKLVASEKQHADGMKLAAEYLDAIPCTVPVKAAGTPGNVEDKGSDAVAKFEALVAEAQKNDPKLTYTAAARLVASSHRDVANAAFTLR